MSKDLKFSRTFWVAVLQAAASVLTAFLSDNPTVDTAASLAFAKAIVDVALRVVTTQPVTLTK